jgi:hypothetical protein
MIAPVWKVEADERSQHLCQHLGYQHRAYQHWDPVGMSFAHTVDDFDVAVARFTANRREASRVSQAGSFIGLDRADGQILLAWLEQAEMRGIDAAIDLSVRPWNIAGVAGVVGIFERNRSKASWLIVRCPAGWMLADCADGAISDVSAALSDILALIGDELRT